VTELYVGGSSTSQPETKHFVKAVPYTKAPKCVFLLIG